MKRFIELFVHSECFIIMPDKSGNYNFGRAKSFPRNNVVAQFIPPFCKRAGFIGLFVVPLSLILILLTQHALFGKTLLEYSGNEIPQKDTSLYEFSFDLSENDNCIVLNLNSNLEQGRLTVWTWCRYD